MDVNWSMALMGQECMTQHVHIVFFLLIIWSIKCDYENSQTCSWCHQTLVLSNQQSKTQNFPFATLIQRGQTASPNVWEAGSIKCLVPLLDQCLKQSIDYYINKKFLVNFLSIDWLVNPLIVAALKYKNKKTSLTKTQWWKADALLLHLTLQKKAITDLQGIGLFDDVLFPGLFRRFHQMSLT